ncbi:MAG: hypothetical protein V4730_11730 [Pseudomonadota bacterium]
MPRGIPRNQDAKNSPVILSGKELASQQDIGQTPPRSIVATDENVELSPQTVVIADKVYDNEKMAMLAFFNEPVTIRIATTTDKAAEKVFEINVNGRPQLFRRGGTYTVPRYYVDRIMRLKQTVYGQEEVFNSEGVKEIRYPSQTALKYDFVIERDDNPRGKDWERSVLAEMS